MRELENDCVGCPQGCINCGRRESYYIWICDKCGEITTNYDEFFHEDDEKDYCESCWNKLFDDVNEENKYE